MRYLCAFSALMRGTGGCALFAVRCLPVEIAVCCEARTAPPAAKHCSTASAIHSTAVAIPDMPLRLSECPHRPLATGLLSVRRAYNGMLGAALRSPTTRTGESEPSWNAKAANTEAEGSPTVAICWLLCHQAVATERYPAWLLRHDPEGDAIRTETQPLWSVVRGRASRQRPSVV